MAIMSANDIGFFFSGGAAKADANGVQGGAISSVQITDQTMENITVANTFWDNVTSALRIAGIIQYRCYYIKNKHASETAKNLKLWKDVTPAGPDIINVGYSGNTPNQQEQTIPVSTTVIYDCPLTTSQAVLDDVHYGQGESPLTTASPIYNKPISKWDVYLRRVGNPPGNVDAKVYAFSDGAMASPLATLESKTCASIPTTSPPVITTFTAPAGSEYSLRVNDVLCVENRESDSNDYIEIYRSANDPIPNTRECRNDTDSWGNVSTYDISGKIYTTGTAGDRTAPSGIVFSNPNSLESAISLPDLPPGAFVGIWLQRIVSANSAAKVDDLSQLCLSFESSDA